MMKLKIKTEHVITFLLAIIIIFPVRLPQYVNELLQNILGKVILVGIGTSLFFYNPMVGSLTLVATYLLLQRSRQEGLDDDDVIDTEEVYDDDDAEEVYDDEDTEEVYDDEDTEEVYDDEEDVDSVEGMANRKHDEFEEECIYPKPIIGKVNILNDDKVNNLRNRNNGVNDGDGDVKPIIESDYHEYS